VIVSELKETPLIFYPHEWVALEDAFNRIRSITRPADLVLLCLNRDLRSGRLGSALVEISPDGKETMTLLNSSDWQQRTVHATYERNRVREGYRFEVKPYSAGHYFVRRADLDKCYPIPATPTMPAAHQPDVTKPPERRRGPILKHEWLAICGEIARRCINPKTRLLEIPVSERKLAKDMLDWCQEKYEKEPAESEMREAVKAICAALRAA
jgi:hypothetical protein